MEALLRAPAGDVSVVERPDGTRLHLLTAGNGPQVLLVHGYGTSVDEWSVVQPELIAAGFRVFAYDARGHGLSNVGSGGLTSASLFSDLEAVADHCELRDAILVGHSMGTFTALGALARGRLDDRVARVVLISPETGDVFRDAPVTRMLAPIVSSHAANLLLKWRPTGLRLAARTTGPRATAHVIEATRRMMVDMPRDASPLVQVMANESVEAGLSAIKQPITVIWGTNDNVTPRWQPELVVSATGADLVELPGVGHMVNWEAPEAILAAITA